MSDKRTKWFLLYMAVGMWAAAAIGYQVGKHAADKWYAEHANSHPVFGMVIIGASESRLTNMVCSVDGKVWWPARADGICYVADKP